MSTLLTDEEIDRQLDDLPGWRRDGNSLITSYDAPDFPSSVQLIVEAGLAAEQMNHHPDVDLRWKVTRWRLSTHSAGPDPPGHRAGTPNRGVRDSTGSRDQGVVTDPTVSAHWSATRPELAAST